MVYNEAHACFYSDIREKKQAGRGIYNKTNGKPKSNWHKDNYTNKEKKEMNGKVYEINTKNPQKLTYEQFKELPKDMQIEWLKAVDEKYDVGAPTLGEAMNASEATIRKIRKNLNVPHTSEKGLKGKIKKRILFENWGLPITEQKIAKQQQQTVLEEKTDMEITKAHNDKNKPATTFIEIEIEGEINTEDIAGYIEQFKNTEVVLRLNIEKK